MPDNGLDVPARQRARYRRQDLAFRILDRVLGLVIWPRTPKAAMVGQRPKRILLANLGYIGDVIMSTSVLPALHHAFAGAEIGYLTGPYARTIVDGHPLIARVHVIDHWYQSRTRASFPRRLLAYLRALPTMRRELRACRYDIAIDLRTWFPNQIPLLWLSQIPVRVGYDRLGWGPLLTHRLTYEYTARHELAYLLDLLKALGVSQESLALASPCLAVPSAQAKQEASALLGGVTRYRVLHPTSSVPARDWHIGHWAGLARSLAGAGVMPVITGSGARDAALASAICEAADESINAVNRLSWDGLIALLSGAELVYAVDTSIGHAASALHRPVVSIYGGMVDPRHWAPIGAAVATNHVPCYPCLDKDGCATRDCLLGVTVENVQSAAALVLPRNVPSDVA